MFVLTMETGRDTFVHVLYAIILAQFAAIAMLLAGFSSEYMQNVFFHAWVATYYPWLGLLLQGQAAGLLVGFALGATVLFIQHIRAEKPWPTEVKLTLKASESHDEKPADVLDELERIDF